MKSCAIIPAAGSGSRMGGVSKPNIVIAGKTLFEHVLKAMEESRIDGVVTVCSSENEASLRALAMGFKKPITFVRGGKTRAESVRNGVLASGDAEIILTHDCARPFISAELINASLEAAVLRGASCVCAPITDTVKMKVSGFGAVTLNRESFFTVQTPQCFKKELYLQATQGDFEFYSSFTDETSLLEASGIAVEYIFNTENNMKLTHERDIVLAEAIMRQYNL